MAMKMQNASLGKKDKRLGSCNEGKMLLALPRSCLVRCYGWLYCCKMTGKKATRQGCNLLEVEFSVLIRWGSLVHST